MQQVIRSNLITFVAKSSVLIFVVVLMQGVQVQANQTSSYHLGEDNRLFVSETNSLNNLNNAFSVIYKVSLEEEVKESHKLISFQHIVTTLGDYNKKQLKFTPPAWFSFPFKNDPVNHLCTIVLLI